jgi:hypothetical protein
MRDVRLTDKYRRRVLNCRLGFECGPRLALRFQAQSDQSLGEIEVIDHILAPELNEPRVHRIQADRLSHQKLVDVT